MTGQSDSDDSARPVAAALDRDVERAIAIWQDVNGLDSAIEVFWRDDDAEYIVSVDAADIELDQLESVLKVARERKATSVTIDGNRVVIWV